MGFLFLSTLSGCISATEQVEKIASVDVDLKQAVPLRHPDNGDGTYTNPPMWADFPDPSIIRVDETFYFATTTFANVPALTILTSKDLLNWSYAGHVIDRLDGAPDYDLTETGAYRRGIFAPSLRYRDGIFYVAVTPVGQKTRIYYSEDVAGPWAYHELSEEAFDPALFFDDDGQVYLATASAFAAGYGL